MNGPSPARRCRVTIKPRGERPSSALAPLMGPRGHGSHGTGKGEGGEGASGGRGDGQGLGLSTDSAPGGGRVHLLPPQLRTPSLLPQLRISSSLCFAISPLSPSRAWGHQRVPLKCPSTGRAGAGKRALDNRWGGNHRAGEATPPRRFHGWPEREQSLCRVRPRGSEPACWTGSGLPSPPSHSLLCRNGGWARPAGKPLLLSETPSCGGAGDWACASLPVCASASPGVLWPAEESDLRLETLSHRMYLCLNRREGPGLLAPGKDKPGALPEASEPLLRSAAQFLP